MRRARRLSPRVASFAAALATGLYLLSPSAAAQTSQFKGWPAVARELSTRLALPGETLELDQFIPAEGLAELLGTWDRFGDEHSFQNGTPNAVNMVIWRVVLSGFSHSIADSCQRPRLAFNPRFMATLRKLCAWPSDGAKTDAVMQEFWFSVMGYNAPEGEYRAWRDFFLTSSYRSRPPVETIDAMTLAITLNPYFLLHR